MTNKWKTKILKNGESYWCLDGTSISIRKHFEGGYYIQTGRTYSSVVRNESNEVVIIKSFSEAKAIAETYIK